MNDIEEKIDEREGKPSASGMARLCLCPGSFMLEQKCPKSEDSDASAEGTLLHKHMEDGSEPEDPEHAELVAWCRQTEEGLVRQVFGDQPEAPYCHREDRLWKSSELYSGQADVVYVNYDFSKALVIDYKFGRGEVERAESNHQLAALSVLVQERYGVNEVYAAILQPRVNRGTVGVVRYNEAELASAASYLEKKVREAMFGNAKLEPGTTQCKYCRAAAICPAQMQLARQVVTAADILAGWDAWSAEQKRQAYNVAVLAKKWAEKVVSACEKDLAAGVPVQGLEMGAGRTSFTVTDAGKAFAELHGWLGITGEEFAACCKVGITELDKLVHAKLKERGESSTVKESKELLRSALATVAESKTSKGSLKVIDY